MRILVVITLIAMHSISWSAAFSLSDKRESSTKNEEQFHTMRKALYCAFLAEGNEKIEGFSLKANKLFNTGVDAGRSFYEKNKNKVKETFDGMGADKMTPDISIGIWIMVAINEVDQVREASAVRSFDTERFSLFQQQSCNSLLNEKNE